MNKEQELRPCPFCGTSNKLKVTPYRADDDGGEPFDWGFTVICSALGLSHAPNRGCGASGAWGETEAEAIAAWNRRAPGVTEEMLKSALAASASQYEVARNLQGSSPKSYAECFGEATPPALAMRAALTAALAVGDEGIREGEAEPFLTGRGWENLSCDDQFALATQIAANIGYDLVPEPEHPDSPHNRAHALPTPPSRGEGE